MAADSAYDPTLTGKIREELASLKEIAPQERSELAALVERLEGEFRRLLDDSAHLHRTVLFLRGPAKPPKEGTPPSNGPVRDTLTEMISLSDRLDRTTEPSEGLAVGERVGRRVHELIHLLEGFLPALRPGELITDDFHRLSALLSRLLKNVIAKVQEFAKLVGATAFTVAFSASPPDFSVSLTFGVG